MILDEPFRGLRRPLLVILVATVVCVGVATTVSYFFHGVMGLIVAVVFGGLSTVSLLWLADRRYGLGFAHDLALVFPQFATFIGFSYSEKE